MAILYVGIDLAKTVFAVRAANEAGKPELVRPNVARTKLLELIVSLPRVIGMETAASGRNDVRRAANRAASIARGIVDALLQRNRSKRSCSQAERDGRIGALENDRDGLLCGSGRDGR